MVDDRTRQPAWRGRVREIPSARQLDTPTLNDHLPQFVAELVAELEEGSGETIARALVSGGPVEPDALTG